MHKLDLRVGDNIPFFFDDGTFDHDLVINIIWQVLYLLLTPNFLLLFLTDLLLPLPSPLPPLLHKPDYHPPPNNKGRIHNVIFPVIELLAIFVGG